MMQAEPLGGTMWRVTDGAGEWTVAVRAADNTEAAALAAVQEMLSPPADVLAAQAAAARSSAAREECRRRILAVVPETAQVNLTAAAAAGLLSPADLATFKAGLGWIAAMRAAWGAVAEGGQPVDAADWPVAPAEVVALGARF
jgi:hypothetical protein